MKKILVIILLLGFSSLAFGKSFTFHVNMTCEACSMAIEKAMIKHHQGMYTNFHADVDNNLITLESDTLTEKQIIKTIEKKAMFKVEKK